MKTQDYVLNEKEVHLLGSLMNRMIDLSIEDGTADQKTDLWTKNKDVPYVYRIGKLYTLLFTATRNKRGASLAYYRQVSCEHWSVDVHTAITRTTGQRGAKWKCTSDIVLKYRDPMVLQTFRDDLMYIKLACG